MVKKLNMKLCLSRSVITIAAIDKVKLNIYNGFHNK